MRKCYRQSERKLTKISRSETELQTILNSEKKLEITETYINADECF